MHIGKQNNGRLTYTPYLEWVYLHDCIYPSSKISPMNYSKLKKAQEALDSDNLPTAFKHFLTCKRTAKISFNLAVLAIWQHYSVDVIVTLLKESLAKDPNLVIAAFYLGIFDPAPEHFQQALKAFRSAQYIDYTQLGMPFVLDVEDVLFNLVSLQDPTADPSHLNALSIQSISTLLLNNTKNQSSLPLRLPPFMHRKMIFNLLPALEPETLALKGPEHVSFIPGEDETSCGFTDAHVRQLKFDILSRRESELGDIEWAVLNRTITTDKKAIGPE